MSRPLPRPQTGSVSAGRVQGCAVSGGLTGGSGVLHTSDVACEAIRQGDDFSRSGVRCDIRHLRNPNLVEAGETAHPPPLTCPPSFSDNALCAASLSSLLFSIRAPVPSPPPEPAFVFSRLGRVAARRYAGWRAPGGFPPCSNMLSLCLWNPGSRPMCLGLPRRRTMRLPSRTMPTGGLLASTGCDGSPCW